MRVLKLCSLFLAIFVLIACSTGKDTTKPVDISNANTEEQGAREDSNTENPNESIDYSNSDLKKIYFAGGCFWGVEAYFERIYGVSETSSGYANGTSTDPTYESVMGGEDGFAETVEVIFDPQRVGLNELLAYFFAVIDPTLEDQQGNDVGVQYRTGVFYVDENQKDMIDNAVKQEQTNYDEEIVTEVLPLDNYYLAEEYHQDYLAKNPNGYCHIDMGVLDDLEVDPNVYKSTSSSDMQNDLTDEQYYVTMENGTEPAYDNEYWDTYEPGIYVDIVSGEPLFTSTTKYDAECGWPSFTKPINPDAVTFHEDNSAGMIRTEVRSKDGDIHLGHIFDDGPEADGGDRYCINSAALEFVHLDDMKEKGYGNIIDLVE